MSTAPDPAAAAKQRAGAVLAAALADINETGAQGGIEAVVRDAKPGTEEEQAALAAYLERLQQEAAEHTPAA